MLECSKSISIENMILENVIINIVMYVCVNHYLLILSNFNNYIYQSDSTDIVIIIISILNK